MAETSFEDPANDRVINGIIPPPVFDLAHNDLFKKNHIPDWRALRDHLALEGRLNKTDIIEITNLFRNIVKLENNIIKIQDPIVIVGDIHGQFYDLLKIIERGGELSTTKYIFLGDYVDRGSFALECVLLLFSLKINYKNTFYMLRGNHECRRLTSFFNFKRECEVKYDREVYDSIMECFDALPLACILNDKFVCLHGGISPDILTLNEINKFNRFTEVPKIGPLCDLLWADPVEKDEEALIVDWIPNRTRGCSFIFGALAINPFLQRHSYLSVIRAHEAQLEGFKMNRWNKLIAFPSVITVFSAPNYCDVYNNKGAFIQFENGNINIQQYNFSPHPFILPDYMNAFNWTIPFISEKVSEMLFSIIKRGIDDDVKETDVNSVHFDVNESLRCKVKFISLIMKMFRTLREENELIMRLKGFCPGNRIPKGILLQGPEALKTAYERYREAKTMDEINEKIPDNNNNI